MSNPQPPATTDEITRAARFLREGGIVAFPTETVYGLGANAFDGRAVARVFEVKGRPWFDPLIVHVADPSWLPRLVVEVPAAAQSLIDRFWPGPLTLVLPRTAAVPDLVTAGCPTVAVRMPDHPLALELLRAAGVPIAAPSANLFGRISPTTAAHVREQLGTFVDLILDGGPCRVGVESTVLQLSPDGATLLRPGGTTLEEIEAVIGPVKVPAMQPIEESPAGQARGEGRGARGEGRMQPIEESSAGQASPGTLPQHYAPRTALVVQGPTHSTGDQAERTAASLHRVGLLAFRLPADTTPYAVVEVLSVTGDLREAAAKFFAALRRLDAAGLELIVAEPFPEQGLGRALNDRLRRAEHS